MTICDVNKIYQQQTKKSLLDISAIVCAPDYDFCLFIWFYFKLLVKLNCYLVFKCWYLLGRLFDVWNVIKKINCFKHSFSFSILINKFSVTVLRWITNCGYASISLLCWVYCAQCQSATNVTIVVLCKSKTNLRQIIVKRSPVHRSNPPSHRAPSKCYLAMLQTTWKTQFKKGMPNVTAERHRKFSTLPGINLTKMAERSMEENRQSSRI